MANGAGRDLRSASFNRTFMELKLRQDSWQERLPQVLIVPLWN